VPGLYRCFYNGGVLLKKNDDSFEYSNSFVATQWTYNHSGIAKVGYVLLLRGKI